MSTENTPQATEGESKEGIKFKANLESLVALLSGDDLLKKRQTLPNEKVMLAMSELTDEMETKMVTEIKADVVDLINGKIAFDKFHAEKQKEFDKAIEEKKKEFNIKANAIFAKVENLQAIRTTYLATLQSIAPPSESSGL